MSPKTKLQAEDLLAEENISEENLSQYAKDGTVDKNEIRFAQNIHSFLSSSVEHMSSSEKEQIKNKIRYSVRKLNMKRQMIWWSVAATILFAAILTSITYLRINSTTEIISFAQTLNHVKAGTNTRLILQNGEEVEIDRKQSQIRYDTKGENIVIDSEQNVVQKMSNTKAVFNTVIVPFGKRTQITLSDGTKVWLNSGSKLVYPALFVGNRREVYIEGEAVFDVAHLEQIPFVVSTKDFDIKVLGTVFNVSSYSDDQYSGAVLAKGKIEIICRRNAIISGEKLEILPGTMAIFDRNHKTFEQKQVNPQKYLSWREGYLIFNSEKLENILRKLGRYYNIDMVITDYQLKNETFSGYLDLKNSPEAVLSVINETTSLSFSISNDKIFINPK
jgi:transmembrane sensor